MGIKKSRWSITDASTAISSGALTFKTNPQQRAKILGFNWATASSMASSVYFRIVVDGSTAISDPVGARLSGYASDPNGLGIIAGATLTAGFTSSGSGGAVSGFFVWGEWA